MSYYNYNNASLRLWTGEVIETEVTRYRAWGEVPYPGDWLSVPTVLSTQHHFPVESLGISLTNQLVPQYLIPDKSSFDYRATQGLIGSINFTYYLTGSDFLARFIHNERQPIRGNFAGLTFQSGFLKNYSFTVPQYGPIKISAALDFFGGIDGTFTPTPETQVGQINPGQQKSAIGSAFEQSIILGGQDCRLSEISGAGIPTPDFPYAETEVKGATSIGFTFDSSYQPAYVVGETMPQGIKFREKNITLEIEGYEITTYAQENFSSGLYDTELKIDIGPDCSVVSEAIGVAETRLETTAGLSKLNPIITSESPDFDTLLVPGDPLIITGAGPLNAEGVGTDLYTTVDWISAGTIMLTDTATTDFIYPWKTDFYVDCERWQKSQSYKTRGTLKSQEINAAVGEKIATRIVLEQQKVGEAPRIDAIKPGYGPHGSVQVIEGGNLKYATSVMFPSRQKVQAIDFIGINDTGIWVAVPDESVNGPITVRSPGGNATWINSPELPRGFFITSDSFGE